MDIFLTRELEIWMRDCIRDGTFPSEGALVRHALRRLRATETLTSRVAAESSLETDGTTQPPRPTNK